MTAARLLAVCTGPVRPMRLASGRKVQSGFLKTPRAGPVAATPLGLDGDEQADLSIHGGLQKAVYAYPSEHLAYWRAARAEAGATLFDEDHGGDHDGGGAAPPAGFVGENLSVRGLLEADVWIGDTLHFGGSACVLRVTAPREPCGKFTTAMGLPDAAQRMVAGARCGFYLAVQAPGALEAGMPIRLAPGARRLSVADAIRAKWARHRHG